MIEVTAARAYALGVGGRNDATHRLLESTLQIRSRGPTAATQSSGLINTNSINQASGSRPARSRSH